MAVARGGATEALAAAWARGAEGGDEAQGGEDALAEVVGDVGEAGADRGAGDGDALEPRAAPLLGCSLVHVPTDVMR